MIEDLFTYLNHAVEGAPQVALAAAVSFVAPSLATSSVEAVTARLADAAFAPSEVGNRPMKVVRR